jgi:glycosyltransferase involved in cell wall biosynthesis
MKPLRILAVVSFPWDPKLGAPQVWMELAAQWEAAGHVVEKYSLSDAFPGGAGSGPKFLINQLRFAYKAAEFVRRNPGRFDVIDAFIGALPFTKAHLRFHGLLVARSVGLHRFYDAFEKEAAQRWPHRPRGGLRGRLFYNLARRQLLRASEASLRNADIISVPNAEEAKALRNELASPERVVVQPYGLTELRRSALANSALPAETRRATPRVCFVGMWSARKGAYDWARLMQLIRAEVPDTLFTFLGTMVDSAKIAGDVGKLEGVELISSYEPAELPTLLAAQTVGAFPSYVEGFGLAVLEQLAAAIPTVAYAAGGPREILGNDLPEMLVPIGDVDAMAKAIVAILQLDVVSYRDLAARSQRCAAKFSWREIAAKTAHVYRAALERSRAGGGPIIFVQPFGLTTAGGGARILRALLTDSPLPFSVVRTSPEPPKAPRTSNELHLPLRPYFGRIERTRFSAAPEKIAPLFRPLFRRRLRNVCRRQRACAIHSIPHACLDFYDSYLIARELRLPFFLQVHDDFRYSSKGRLAEADADAALGEVWGAADLRFVISRQLGDEYCRRYGVREFITVTDGIATVTSEPRTIAAEKLRIYFMGLFHIGYEANLRILVAAITRLRAERPALELSLTMRCGELRSHLTEGVDGVRILPFGSEADVRADLENADLLYLPLPFGTEFEHFTTLSLSTKLVTYLGSGLPIVYHGPSNSAGCQLLQEHRAAFLVTSKDAAAMAMTLDSVSTDPAAARAVTVRALELARSQFMLADQRRKFWDAIAPFCGPR